MTRSTAGNCGYCGGRRCLKCGKCQNVDCEFSESCAKADR